MGIYRKSDPIYAELRRIRDANNTICKVVDFPALTLKGVTMQYMLISHIPAGAATPDQSLSVLITGGVLGNELMAPEALADFAATCVNLVSKYRPGTPVNDANDAFKRGGYVLKPSAAQRIIQNLNIYIAPVINPDGRDLYLGKYFPDKLSDGRKNTNSAVAPRETPAKDNNPPGDRVGVCINRNFAIMWPFETKFKLDKNGRYGVNDNVGTSPSSQNYRGPGPESEPETQNVAKLIRGDPKMTFVFDIHGSNQSLPHRVDYPPGWGNHQSMIPTQNFSNPAHDNVAGNAVIRPGTHDPNFKEGDPTVYGEFIPWEAVLGNMSTSSLAQAFEGAAAAVKNQKGRWKSGYAAESILSTGSLDDYMVSLNPKHARGYTIECADLQPAAPLLTDEREEVQAGLLGALDYIAQRMDADAKKGNDPAVTYGR